MKTCRLLILVFCVLHVESYICPPGWQSWGDNCYFISLRSMLYQTWDQADVSCRLQQGNLLYIETEDEYKWLSERLISITQTSGLQQQWWTGLNDQKTAGDWVWSGTDQPFTNTSGISWGPGYPPQNTEADCKDRACSRCSLVSTRYDYVNNKGDVAGLSTQTCRLKNPYICKRVNISSTPSKCDYGAGWYHIGEACWKPVYTGERSWDEASEYCEYIEDGKLATIHTKDEQNALLSVTNSGYNTFWIGLQVNKTGGATTGQWVDGSELEHDTQVTYWAPGQPNFERISVGCVYMDNKVTDGEGWHNDACYEDHAFICQRPYAVCPPGWVTFHGRCYELNIRDKMSWQGALEYCRAQNTSMLEIDSDWEKTFLIDSGFLFRRGVDSLWLGFQRNGDNDTWATSGNIVTIPVDTPNDINTEIQPLCGIHYTDGGQNATVTDNCANAHAFVCEAAAVDSIIDYHHPPRDTFCDDGFMQYKGHCYKINPLSNSWYNAQKACKDDGGNLVSIEDSQEQAFLNAITSQSYWIGLSSYGKTHNWKWQDLSKTDYLNFMIGYTRSLRDNANNCVNMMGSYGRYKGMWGATSCESLMPSICEKLGTKYKPTPRPTRGVDPECGIGWVSSADATNSFGDNFCYQLNRENLVWSEADAKCKENGGQLASVSNSHEQLYIQVWLGGNDQNAESAWGWVDGTPFSYINWAGQSSQGRGNDNCISMKIDNKNWLSEDCRQKRPFICKKQKMGAISTTPFTPTTTFPTGMDKSCPDTYHLIGSNCYKFYNESGTQRYATDTCKSDGAFLASAASEQEDINEIHYGWVFLGHRNTPLWWIGLEDRDGNGEFTWQDGSPVTYVDWSKHEPKQLPYNEKCVMMTWHKASWEVRACNDVADGFICKAKPILTPATTPPKTIELLCPNMAHEMTDSTCYLLALSSFGWETAKESCAHNNMELVWLDNPEEQAYILEHYRRIGVSKFWVNYKNENYTYSVNGLDIDTDVYMGNWNKDHTGKELDSCAFVRNDGQWYDGDCGERLPFVCKAYRLDYRPPIKPDMTNTTCPKNWNKAGNMCYKAVQEWARPNKKSWFDARDYCRSLGGDLASIHPHNMDQESIKAMFGNEYGNVLSSDYWIGLNRLDRSKGHVWSDGSSWDYSAWDDPEPNDHLDSEDCVLAKVDSGWQRPITMKWNDLYCQTAQDFVCQLPLGMELLTTIPTTQQPTISAVTGVQGKCDSGWLQFGSNCYKFKMNWFSWFEANNDCTEKEGGHLATIHSREENDFIVSQITTTFYKHWAIGLRQTTRDKWEWVDGSVLDFVFWHPKEPSDHGGAENCAQIYHDRGFWNDYNCGTSNGGSICEKPVNGITLPPRTTTGAIKGFCMAGYDHLGNHCYKLMGVDSPLNWTQAQEACRAEGDSYDLASVHSREEQAFISLMMHSTNRSAWIGLSDFGIRSFTWSDNTETDYTSWADGPTYSSWDIRSCARVLVDEDESFGMWKQTPCEESHAFLCKGIKDSRIATHATTTQSSQSCTASGYQGFDGQCYKVYTDLKTFDEASEQCASDGAGMLASIADVHEQNFIHVKLAQMDVNDSWIGMKRLEYNFNAITVGEYAWQDGFPVEYSSWSADQPRHISGVENCVSMNVSNGEWTSIDCSTKLSFICKISNKELPTPAPMRYLCKDPLATAYRNKCYKVYTPRFGRTWQDASNDCLQEGMSLVSIHDGDQQNFITELISLSSRPQEVWIGYYQSKLDEWHWSDQSELEFEQWDVLEPNKRKFSGGNCAYLKYRDNSIDYGANWTVGGCSFKKGFICQAPSYVVTEPTTPTTSTASTTTGVTTTGKKLFCFGDTDWMYYNGYCYYESSEQKSWHEGELACKMMSAELVSFHSMEEIDAVLSSWSYKYRAAIGFTKLGRSNWGWTDKSLVDFVNWQDGEPNNNDGSERCGYMFLNTRYNLHTKGSWNDAHCGTEAHYICKKPENPKPITLGPLLPKNPPGHCPSGWAEYGKYAYNTGVVLSGWAEYGGKCYGLFSDGFNWTQARDSCRTKGHNSDLVTIYDVRVQAFLTSQLYIVDANVWIGLSDRYHNGQFWWSSNEPVTFTNWMMNEPDRHYTKDCVEMSLHRILPGKWRDNSCNVTQPYICEMDKDPAIDTPAPMPSSCSADYSLYYQGCYKLHKERLNRADAHDACLREGAFLVSITSPYEQAFVESLLAYETEPAWIGMIELIRGGANEFIWEDNWPVTFTTWGDNRPLPSTGAEARCVLIDPNTGRWNDTACLYSHSFICKQPFDQPPTTPALYWDCPTPSDIGYGDKCFRLSGDEEKTWSDAHLDCLQQFGQLASFHSLEEYYVVIDGLNALNKRYNIWVGLIRNINGGFYWMDQTPVDWTYWMEGEPDDTSDDEACVEAVWDKDGRWNDISCTNKLHYVCEVPAVARPTTTTAKPSTTTSTTSNPTTSRVPSKRPSGTTSTAGNLPHKGKNKQGNPDDKTSRDNSSLIVGIVVALLVVCCIIGGAGFVLYRQKTRSSSNVIAQYKPGGDNSKTDGTIRFENQMYDHEMTATNSASDPQFASA